MKTFFAGTMRGLLWVVLVLMLPGIAAAQNSVAVLPFANTSGDAAQDALADGLTEEIAAALATVKGLNVGARSSAFRFKAQPRDFRAIGEQLKKTHLVEGTVRKADDRVRLSARLVRASDGMQLWSEDYYTPFADIFDIQDAIAKSVASALQVRVDAAPVPSRTRNMAAYEQYLRARPLIRARGPKPFADAAVILEQAVAGDPNFAPASAMLAFDYDISPLYQASFRSGDATGTLIYVSRVIPEAERLAKRATELEPGRAEGFVALAYANMVQRKLLAADDLFKKALTLDPNQTDGLHGYSQLLAVEGRIKESLAMRLKLQALEPFVNNYVADTALIYWLDKDDATAIRMLDEFRPNRTAEIAQIHAAMGKHKEAASLLREMTAANYLPGVLDGAASLLDNAPSRTASPASLPRLGNLSFVYLHVGAPDRVFEFYEAALQAGYFQPISTTWLWHDSYAPVRKTERFKKYIRDIGLEEFFRARGWPAHCRPTSAQDFACD
jgi:TolB-like protein/tetratricopeptide (TPR) repeat protein